MSDFNYQATGEMLRRRAGGQPSGAGIPGQSGAAPSTIASPVQQQGMNRMNMAGMPMKSPMMEATKALNSAIPEQATMIIKSLDKALHKMIPEQNANPQ